VLIDHVRAEERKACVAKCQEIAIGHSDEEGTYAAGEKAGAFECAEVLNKN
jgi:hypothetical protein